MFGDEISDLFSPKCAFDEGAALAVKTRGRSQWPPAAQRIKHFREVSEAQTVSSG